MKTIGVRVDDDTAELLQAAAGETATKTSDLVRLAVRNLLAELSEDLPQLKKLQAELAEARELRNSLENAHALGLSRAPVTLGEIPVLDGD